jgi:2-oxoglutarate ferredoxin oxidoreductase subunit delta
MEEKEMSKSFKVAINNWCKHCGICYAFCPVKVFTRDEKERVFVTHPEKCIGCRMCEYRCPDLAITVSGTEEDKNA